MSLPKHEGQVSAIYRPGSEVESIELTDTHGRFVAPGSLTAGRFGLYRWDMGPRAGGAAAHFHKTFSESFYVLSGTIRLGDGERWIDASEGDFLFVPEFGIHAFRNESGSDASMLILFAPGPPREKYFKELAEIISSGRQMSSEEWDVFYAQHDQYMV